jgi:hypothetical protein
MVVYQPRPGVNPVVKLALGAGVAVVAVVLIVLTLRALLFPPARSWPPDHPCYYVAGYVKSVEELTKQANQELDNLSSLSPGASLASDPFAIAAAIFRGAATRLDEMRPPQIATAFHEAYRAQWVELANLMDRVIVDVFSFFAAFAGLGQTLEETERQASILEDRCDVKIQL